MTGHRRLSQSSWRVILLGAVVAALMVAGLVWKQHVEALPQQRFAGLLVESSALELPGRPEAVVVLAKPGGWVRLLARNQERALLLDPSWWQSLSRGTLWRAPSTAAPSAGLALILDQFPHGLVVALWRNGWVVQGAVRGSAVVRRLCSFLPKELSGKWRLEDGMFRLASESSLLSGRTWKLRPSIDPSRRLACWIWVDGVEWPGWWEDDRLVFERGDSPHSRLPSPLGSILAHVEQGQTLSAFLLSRMTTDSHLGELESSLTEILDRPVILWLRRLMGGSALPRAELALDLKLMDDETAEGLCSALQSVLCRFDCSEQDTLLASGRPAMRWSSGRGTWWVVKLPEDAVVAATGQSLLETLLAKRESWPRGNWAVVGGDAAASSLQALASGQGLPVLGVLQPVQLNQLRRTAEPLRGLTSISWEWSTGGSRIEIRPSSGE